MQKQKKKKMRSSTSDKVLYGSIMVLLTLIGVIMLYPLLYVLACSFSTPESVMSGEVILFPVEFSLEGYKAVFRTNRVLLGFRNSAFYTVFGTILNVITTIIAAYPLSRKDLPGRSVIMKLFTFTMIFGGGMIPNYLLMRDLKIMNTIWVMILPGLLSIYNMIVMRTFFQNSIPGELLEASKMDGCTDIKYLNAVVMPLSKSIIAVITLYYAVGHWNAYFNAFMYLNDDQLYPLQIFLRQILIANQVSSDMIVDDMLNGPVFGIEYILKYALIVVATVPMLIIYPFVQKHFVKGVMIGAVKG